MQDLALFFETEHFIETKVPGTYRPNTLGAAIACSTQSGFNWEEADFIIVGCNEWRGEGAEADFGNGADAIREELYRMYYWHRDIKIADAGNIRLGHSVEDTRAALTEVLAEIQQAGKIALVIGGSHDLTLSQYGAFKKCEKNVVMSVADMLIDLEETEVVNHESFLLDMLTAAPNFITHYNHLAFQSYYANPSMVETLDKLRFDFFRLGRVREEMEEMEPVLRSTNLFSLDLNAVKHSDAPANRKGSPNGLTGEEVCRLSRFAGMSTELSSFGIYGYRQRHDRHNLSAILASQMIWYFIDGLLVRKTEAKLTNRDEFLVFNVAFTENDTTFLKSKRTNRWWMELPNKMFVPCSYNDYVIAGNDGIPERWLREQERLV